VTAVIGCELLSIQMAAQLDGGMGWKTSEGDVRRLWAADADAGALGAKVVDCEVAICGDDVKVGGTQLGRSQAELVTGLSIQVKVKKAFVRAVADETAALLPVRDETAVWETESGVSACGDDFPVVI
jgi:hypothetical protein